MPSLPPPRREPLTETLHGIPIQDPYRWLEDGDDPEVVAWQDAERARFQEVTDGLVEVERLKAHFERLWRVADERPPQPVHRGDRLFSRTRQPDQDKWVIHVQDGLDGERRVLLDPNTWASTQTLAGFWPSFDGGKAIVGRAQAGNEDPELLLLDVETGILTPEPTTGWRRGGVTWHPDGRGFWFSGRPRAGTVPEGDEHYWHQVWFHRLGQAPERDEQVFFTPGLKKRFHGTLISDDGRWLVLGSYAFSSNGFVVVDLESGERRLATDDHDANYDPFFVGDRMYVRTDRGAPRFRLMVGDPARPGFEHWKELVPEGEGVLEDARAIGGRLYLTWREDLVSRVCVHDLDGRHLHDIAWPGEGSARVWGFAHRDQVWASFESYARPATFYRYDPDERELHELHVAPVPMDTRALRQTLVWVTSKDGTPIPVFVLHRGADEGPRPVLLTGYGGFNVSRLPMFSTVYASWAALGGAVAVACLRGGGEYGRDWHDAGKGPLKQNVFDDFFAAAEGLVEQGWTTPDQLAISGGSNGGLLVAAAVVQRPELFGAARCAVPLTDMVRFPRFGIAAVWTGEYGDPAEADALAWLHAYSPYHHAEPASYPAILVTGSLNDARTDPVHARKMYAALRHAQQGTRPVLLHVQADSGHHGAVTIADLADQTGRDHGFLMHHVGLEVAQVGR